MMHSTILLHILFHLCLSINHSSQFSLQFTSELQRLVFKKNYTHAQYKSSLILDNYRKYSLCRTRYKYLSKKFYRSFITHTEASLTLNPRYFWNFVRRNWSFQTIPDNVILESVVRLNSNSSNLFSKFFSSVCALPKCANSTF